MRITAAVASRRLTFRAEEIAHAVATQNDDMLIGHARAAWAIALRLPKDIVAELVKVAAKGTV